jgi:hypothetical protein
MAEKKTKTIRVSDNEYAAIYAAREQLLAGGEVSPMESTPSADANSAGSMSQLTKAFADAINATRPPDKITVANRKARTPWTPPEGVPRSKFKRRFYHHGISLLDGDILSNEEIDLLNEIRPGIYMDGNVTVKLRKDRGVDIDYKVSTASDRLKLVNRYKVTSFADLLSRIVEEHNNPEQYRKPDELSWS